MRKSLCSRRGQLLFSDWFGFSTRARGVLFSLPACGRRRQAKRVVTGHVAFADHAGPMQMAGRFVNGGKKARVRFAHPGIFRARGKRHQALRRAVKLNVLLILHDALFTLK